MTEKRQIDIAMQRSMEGSRLLFIYWNWVRNISPPLDGFKIKLQTRLPKWKKKSNPTQNKQ